MNINYEYFTKVGALVALQAEIISEQWSFFILGTSILCIAQGGIAKNQVQMSPNTPLLIAASSLRKNKK